MGRAQGLGMHLFIWRICRSLLCGRLKKGLSCSLFSSSHAPSCLMSFFPLFPSLSAPTSSAWQLLNYWGPLSLLSSSSSCYWIMWRPPPLRLTHGPLSWCWPQCWEVALNLSSNHISNRSPTHLPSPTSARNINRSAERSLILVVVDLFLTYLPENDRSSPLSYSHPLNHILVLLLTKSLWWSSSTSEVLLWNGKELLFKLKH